MFAIGLTGQRPTAKSALEIELLHLSHGFVVRREPHASLHEDLTNIVEVKPQLQALPNQVRSHAFYDELLVAVPARDKDP